jgi:septum formation protein
MRKPDARLPSRIILASASPRRDELLRQIGIVPIIRPAHIDEELIRHDDPARLATELAAAKALAVVDRAEDGLAILGADTVVAVAGEILEKPSDRADAARMVRLLSGRTHQVITGIAVVRRPGDPPVARFAESHVTFAELSDVAIDEYLASGEWRGVAGAYRIQGVAARYITWLAGSYSNVVGLPLHLVYSILME